MNTLTPTPESQVDASEHAATSADDKIILDEIIAKFEATADEDVRAREILAAATTLRDSTGRDRKNALRKMANAWGVTLNDKVADKYKPRPNAALEKDIQASVCQAALDWEFGMERDTEPLRKKTKTTDAADHDASVATHLKGTRVQPPRDQDEPAESSASRSGGGDQAEAVAPDHCGGAELHDAPSKRQRTLTQQRFRTGWRTT